MSSAVGSMPSNHIPQEGEGGFLPQDISKASSLESALAEWWVRRTYSGETEEADEKVAGLIVDQFVTAVNTADTDTLDRMYVTLANHPELVSEEFLTGVLASSTRGQLKDMQDALKPGVNPDSIDIVTYDRIVRSGINAPGIGPVFLQKRLEAHPEEAERLSMNKLLEETFSAYLFDTLGLENIVNVVRVELEEFADSINIETIADNVKYLRTSVNRILKDWGDGLQSGTRNAGLALFGLVAGTRGKSHQSGDAEAPQMRPDGEKEDLLKKLAVFFGKNRWIPILGVPIAIAVLLLGAAKAAPSMLPPIPDDQGNAFPSTKVPTETQGEESTPEPTASSTAQPTRTPTAEASPTESYDREAAEREILEYAMAHPGSHIYNLDSAIPIGETAEAIDFVIEVMDFQKQTGEFPVLPDDFACYIAGSAGSNPGALMTMSYRVDERMVMAADTANIYLLDISGSTAIAINPEVRYTTLSGVPVSSINDPIGQTERIRCSRSNGCAIAIGSLGGGWTQNVPDINARGLSALRNAASSRHSMIVHNHSVDR